MALIGHSCDKLHFQDSSCIGVDVKPVLQALVLAERIFETIDRRKIICGTFTAIELKTTSKTGDDGIIRGGSSGSPYAYLSLTDVCDGTTLTIQFVSLRRNHVLFGKDIVLKCNDRLANIEIVLPLPHLHVGENGTYAFEVVCEGEILGSSRIGIRITDDDESEGEEQSPPSNEC